MKEDDLTQRRQEVERASNHYYHTPQQLGIDNRTKKFIIERCLPFVKGPNVLELGYVDGSWSDLILKKGNQLEIVEGASKHIEHAKRRFGAVNSVEINHCLFQEFEPNKQYDTIIAGDMIRYLDDPERFLHRCSSWLKPNGILIVTAPNNRSLHRRIGSLMRLESTPSSPNTRDREVGNLRSYDRYELRNMLEESGYIIEELRGCFLKPLSSSQMDHWSDELLEAFLEIGNEMEDYCWFLYAICSKRAI